MTTSTEGRPEPDDETTAAPEGQQDPTLSEREADDEDTDRRPDEPAQ